MFVCLFVLFQSHEPVKIMLKKSHLANNNNNWNEPDNPRRLIPALVTATNA